MVVRYKGDILKRLKEAGYSQTRLRKEKIFGQGTLQQFRDRAYFGSKTLNRLCELLNCDVGDILEYAEEDEE